MIAFEYNPFKRQLPTVTVGQYIRDFTEYMRDEEEAISKTNDTWLEVFQIGDTDQDIQNTPSFVCPLTLYSLNLSSPLSIILFARR